jgi:hypothetical protein
MQRPRLKRASKLAPVTTVRSSQRRQRSEVRIAAGPQQPTPSLAYLQNVFRDRCEARAILVAACEMDFHEAIDGLQAAASEYGLIRKLGQDAVQAMMAEAFAKVPRAGELEDAFAAMADFLTGFLIEKASEPQRFDVPRSTIDAVSFLIKQNDPRRLRTWLAKCTPRERVAIKQQFKRELRNT